jgi:hypothetical protein
MEVESELYIKNNSQSLPQTQQGENKFLIYKKECKIISDYFIFDENDIDLYKMKKCFSLYLDEFSLTTDDLVEIEKNFKEFLLFVEKNDMNKFTFPCLKNSVMGFLTVLTSKNNNEYATHYFFLLLLSNKTFLKTSVKNFYLSIVRNNYFGISPGFGHVITREVVLSDEYKRFTDFLAEWYAKIEMIIFYISILNQYHGIMLNFDEKKYSLENNFDFSIKSFAKKNLLKLASFIFKKTSLDIQFGELNYNHLFLIISSFTCGLSVTDLFSGGDLRKLCYIGVIIHNLGCLNI